MSTPRLLLVAWLSLAFGAAPAEAPPAVATGNPNHFVQVAQKLRAAVVSITISKARGYEIDRARKRRSPAPQYYGSGLIIDRQGHILTNNHVVDEALRIQVTLADGSNFPAEIVGQDPETDLSLIRVVADDRIDAHNVAHLGDSDSVQVGDWVMAVGSPFGLNHTVSVGVISAKGRRLDTILGDAAPPSFQDFLQTDASINPGNSGGPLVNMNGQVVGINTAYNPAAPGIGFAIPINLAGRIVGELRSHGKVVRGYLGVYPQDLTQDLSEALRISSSGGVLVGEVEPDSPAEHGGLVRGDIILKFSGRSVLNTAGFLTMVSNQRPGSEVQLSILRNGAAQTLPVLLGRRPSMGQGPVSPAPSPQDSDWPGLEVENRSGIEGQRLRVARTGQGVVVSYLTPGGIAEERGIVRGDVILEINKIPLWNTREYRKILRKAMAQSKPALFLVLKRDEGVTRFVALRPAKK